MSKMVKTKEEYCNPINREAIALTAPSLLDFYDAYCDEKSRCAFSRRRMKNNPSWLHLRRSESFPQPRVIPPTHQLLRTGRRFP